jgi:hypothetical protein
MSLFRTVQSRGRQPPLYIDTPKDKVST